MMQKSPITSSVALSSLENETVMPNREKSTYKGKLPATLWVKVQKNNTHVFVVSKLFCYCVQTSHCMIASPGTQAGWNLREEYAEYLSS